jgi:TonB family protein
MKFDDFWKRFVSFGLAFSLGLFAAAFWYQINFANIFRQKTKLVPKKVSSTNNGRGASGCCDNGDYVGETDKKTADTSLSKVQGVKIISKPRAIYTDEARLNQIQGKVLLRVTFSANGQIGAISIISSLPDGLTEAAITAAKGIKFEPAKRNGVPYSVTKPVEYNFWIY